jgi:serine/threonine protein kinase
MHMLAMANDVDPEWTLSSSFGQNEEDLTVATFAAPEFADTPIPDDLKDLIYKCLNRNPNNRPSLDELIQACEDAVLGRTEMDYAGAPGAMEETDEGIKRFVQMVLFDAEYEDRHARTASQPVHAEAVYSQPAGTYWRA